MDSQRNNLLAGIFLLLGALALCAVIFLLADLPSFFEPQQHVRVIYRLSDGLQGLRPGAALTLGGQPVGQVTDITDVCAPADNPQRVVAKLVTLQLPQRYRLYDNAEIELVVPTLGAGTYLNIRNVGDGTPLRPDQPLQGAVAGNLLTASLLRDAGVDDQQRRQIREIISNVRDLSAAAASAAARLDTLLASSQPLIARTLASLETTAAQLKLASIEIRRCPWRLLYRPTNRELETENLYDSARSFALAADSLDSAAQSLAALRQSPAADPADVQRMLEHLRQLFSRFEHAERQFWQSLDRQAAAK